MISIITRIVMSLSAGAAISVAVAWGSVFVVDPRDGDRQYFFAPEPSYTWTTDIWTTRTATRVMHSEMRMCGNVPPTPCPPVAPAAPWWGDRQCSPRSGWEIPIEEARGWPLRALWCEYVHDFSTQQVRSDRSHGGWELPFQAAAQGAWDDVKALPLRPIWPGFAINALMYAALPWLLLTAPLALRKRRRIKRGLCPKCAYDLRGSTSGVCPECGGDAPNALAS